MLEASFNSGCKYKKSKIAFSGSAINMDLRFEGISGYPKNKEGFTDWLKKNPLAFHNELFHFLLRLTSTPLSVLYTSILLVFIFFFIVLPIDGIAYIAWF